MAERAVHVIITGHVQGVGFRWWTIQKASALGLIGWVRNRIDNSVEAVFSGSVSAVDIMLEHCWSGPPPAKVNGVRVSDTEILNVSGFTHRPTA